MPEYWVNLATPRTAPSGYYSEKSQLFMPCFLLSSLLPPPHLPQGGMTLGYHFSMLTPDEFRILHVLTLAIVLYFML